MNWLAVGRYILARTREPSTVHRAVAAIGGLMASFSLSGPEKWVAMVVSASALIGILMPDTERPTAGFGDRESSEPLPPIELVAKPTLVRDVDCSVQPVPDSDLVRRQPMPAEHRVEENPYPDKFESGGGWGDK